MSESVAEDLSLYISPRSQKFGLAYCTLLRVLHLDFNLNRHKVQLIQQIKPG